MPKSSPAIRTEVPRIPITVDALAELAASFPDGEKRLRERYSALASGVTVYVSPAYIERLKAGPPEELHLPGDDDKGSPENSGGEANGGKSNGGKNARSKVKENATVIPGQPTEGVAAEPNTGKSKSS